MLLKSLDPINPQDYAFHLCATVQLNVKSNYEPQYTVQLIEKMNCAYIKISKYVRPWLKINTLNHFANLLQVFVTTHWK